MPIDIQSIRAQFPILERKVNGSPLTYLDNAATTHNPRAVMEASQEYYSKTNSNIHRGVHFLSREATNAHEEARATIAKHFNAAHRHEIIFTSGTTESINLVSSILGLSKKILPGDKILVSELEHHSNIVPWQMLCQQTGAELEVLPITDLGEWDLTQIDSLLTEKTKVVALNHVSNALGTINPVEKVVAKAKSLGAITLIDGAQSAPHMQVDVQALGADFYAFSGHKCYAPTGIGVLWGRADLLETLPPYKGGGEMIKQVSFAATSYNDLPFKYEAGTPNIEGAIALARAFDWINAIGIDAIAKHEQSLLESACAALAELEGVHLYANVQHKAAVISFNISGVHHYDLGTLVDKMGVAVRTGHHCCQPLMARLGVTGTVRASFAIYNNQEDVQALVNAVKKASTILA